MPEFNVIVGTDYSYPTRKRRVTAPDSETALETVKADLSGDETVNQVIPLESYRG